MRKKFILFVLIPLVILLIVTWLFIDRWIESAFEFTGEELTGARVEIDQLDLSLSPLAISFNRLEVASPSDSFRNLFETGKVHFEMNFAQVLRGKTIIDVIQVEDLILGTKRTTNGILPNRRGYLQPDSGEQSFSRQIGDLFTEKIRSTPIFDPALWRKSLNVDSLINAQNFQTLALVDSLQQRTAVASAEWDSSLQVFQDKREHLEDLKVKLVAINPAELKTVDEVSSAISTVDNARTTLKDLSATFDGRYETITSEIQLFSASVYTLDDAVKSDVQQVLTQARLPDIDAMGLAEQLVGRKILSDAQQAAKWIDAGRSFARRYSPAPDYEKPPRLRGQDIHFPVRRGYPKLWIREIRISGGTDRAQNPEYIYLQGIVKNISSDQSVAGEPLRIDLSGGRGDGIAVSLAALLDRRQDTPVDEYTASLSGVRLKSFDLGKRDFLPTTVSAATLGLDVTATVPGRSFDIKGDMQFRSLDLKFQIEPRNLGERIARDVLTGVNGFDAGFRIWRKEGGVDAAFTTDLDNQFAVGIKRVVGAELAALQNQIRSRVQDEIAGKRRAFEQAFNARKTDVQDKLDTYKSLIDENKKMIEEKKKELEARLEQVKKGAVDKVLKDVFKKK